MTKLAVLLVWVNLFVSCLQEKHEFTCKITSNAAGGYGYQIFQKEKQVIDQPFIPGITSVKGFATKADAGKIGNLVIWKMEHGKIPPGITPEELDSLKIAR